MLGPSRAVWCCGTADTRRAAVPVLPKGKWLGVVASVPAYVTLTNKFGTAKGSLWINSTQKREAKLIT